MSTAASDNPRLLGYGLLVFLAGSSYGFIVPTVKFSMTQGIYPFEFLPLQYVVALVGCLAFALVRHATWPSLREMAKLALLGVFTGLTSICYYTSVSLLPSAAALTLLFQYVWVGILIECIAARRLPDRATVLAVVIVLVGTVFAAGIPEGKASALDPMGVALGAASAVFYALFLFCSGRIGVEHRPCVRATLLTVGGLVVTTIVNPGCFVAGIEQPELWPYAVLMSILGVILPTTLINYASPRLPDGMVPVLAASELPVGIFAAWAIVGDRPSALVLLGAFLVLAGIVVRQFPALAKLRRRKAG